MVSAVIKLMPSIADNFWLTSFFLIPWICNSNSSAWSSFLFNEMGWKTTETFSLYLLILWNTLGTGVGSSLMFVSVLLLRFNTNSFSWVPAKMDVPSRFEQCKVNSTANTLWLIVPTPCANPIWFWQESVNAVSLSRTSQSLWCEHVIDSSWVLPSKLSIACQRPTMASWLSSASAGTIEKGNNKKKTLQNDRDNEFSRSHFMTPPI